MKTLLIAINSKFVHKSPAVWALKSFALSKSIEGIEIFEGNINTPQAQLLRQIVRHAPDVAAFSCYIWNIDLVQRLAVDLKKVLPKVKIIIGGPEVIAAKDGEYAFADYILRGEGEESFCSLLKFLESKNENESDSDGDDENGEVFKSLPRIIEGASVDFFATPTPYNAEYFESFTGEAIGSQLIYYESSRGCPFSCSYCLSGGDNRLRNRDFELVKEDLSRLLRGGAKTIKFVDRTFNADKKRALKILEFILGLDTDATFHFEVAGDLFSEALYDVISKMPRGRVQFEIGVQSFNDEVLSSVCRKTDTAEVLKCIKRLKSYDNCHVHADLIAGLPTESLASFVKGFNLLIATRPDMLQLGFLKYLKGSSLRQSRPDDCFSEFPPYEIFHSDAMSLADIEELKSVENALEKFYNSGMFTLSCDHLLSGYFAENNYQLFKDLGAVLDSFPAALSLSSLLKILTDFVAPLPFDAVLEEKLLFDYLSIDPKAVLPTVIEQRRDKKRQYNFQKESGFEGIKVVVLYFKFLKRFVAFVYDKKDKLSGRYKYFFVD